MDITITINTDNAAFGVHEESKDLDTTIEVIRILKQLAWQWEGGIDDATIYDINGNKVGSATI